jgi:putative transposase
MPWAKKEPMNQRSEFVMRAKEAGNFRALCREYGISARVGYKWLKRFEEEGLRGMGDRSRKPKRAGSGLAEEVVLRIVRLRERHRHWGARKLREVYRRSWGEPPSESSFKRVLERSGMVKKRRIRKSVESGRIADGRRAQAPNEVWTVDFKGWWKDGHGRCTPLTVRDEFSRYVLELRAVEDGTGETVKECFEELFARYGLPKAIRSDNGTPFASPRAVLGLSALSAWWLALGIDLERSRPGCPQDNGGHERMHRDIASEVETARPLERQAAFDTWRREFNHERPHEALDMKTPHEVYQKSERQWTGTVEQLSYPKMATRKVCNRGMICIQGVRLFVSYALRGWNVGLKPGSHGRWQVYFAQLLIGMIELETEAFIPATNHPSPEMKAAA